MLIYLIGLFYLPSLSLAASLSFAIPSSPPSNASGTLTEAPVGVS